MRSLTTPRLFRIHYAVRPTDLRMSRRRDAVRESADAHAGRLHVRVSQQDALSLAQSSKCVPVFIDEGIDNGLLVVKRVAVDSILLGEVADLPN
jgi:hypothetical protein